MDDFHTSKIIEVVTLLVCTVAQQHALPCLRVKFASLRFRHMCIGTASEHAKGAYIWLGTAPCFMRGDSFQCFGWTEISEIYNCREGLGPESVRKL